MSGLVGYGSSDEEDENEDVTIENGQPIGVSQIATTSDGKPEDTARNEKGAQVQGKATEGIAIAPPGLSAPSIAPLEGPTLGPSFPAANEADSSSRFRPESPHTAYRNTIQGLTLPTVPNFDIPPSPPGSPPPGTDAKIKQFLKLKKQGLHFNEKLASSSALKNPSLLGKLIANAGLEEEQQYATALPRTYWDPTQFQDWMYKENLERAKRDAEKRRMEGAGGQARTAVDFISAQDRSMR